MRAGLFILTFVAALLVAPFGNHDNAGTALAQQGLSLEATLTGEAQVPTPVTTSASGKFTASLNADQAQLSFELQVSNLVGVTQAHIHCGGAEENGPIAAFLYGLADPMDVDGVLSTETLTTGDLVGGEACAASFGDFVDALLNGQAYVNVHTEANPSGEVRGQVLQAQAAADAEAAAVPSTGGPPPVSGEETSTWIYIVIAAGALALLGSGALALRFRRER